LARDRARLATPVTLNAVDASSVAKLPRRPTLVSAMAAQTHGMLNSGNVWLAFAVGLSSTVPPVEGPLVLAVIMGSRADAGTQFSAFIVFILLALVFVEIPLVSYLAVPQKTEAVMMQMNSWITTHRRQIFETILGVVGVVSLVQGIGSL